MIITLNNKGIGRAQMPQIGRANTANFQSYLNGLGVNLTVDVVPAASLKATQSELNSVLLDRVRDGFDPKVYPLLTAADGFVLDGHNRLYVGTEKGMDLDILRADCSIADLLKLAREFPDVSYKAVTDLGCRKGLR